MIGWDLDHSLDSEATNRGELLKKDIDVRIACPNLSGFHDLGDLFVNLSGLDISVGEIFGTVNKLAPSPLNVFFKSVGVKFKMLIGQEQANNGSLGHCIWRGLKNVFQPLLHRLGVAIGVIALREELGQSVEIVSELNLCHFFLLAGLKPAQRSLEQKVVGISCEGHAVANTRLEYFRL